jgi:pimeloyl-ACP methyl ester carboxylesterase
VVFWPGLISPVEFGWEDLAYGDFLTQLASFARLILFDKRGTGLSDRISGVPPLEERMQDVRAVMDAVGSERAALVTVSEGGPMCALFAATYPERTAALVLLNTFASLRRDDACPWGFPAESLQATGVWMETRWGTGQNISLWAPSLAADEAARRWLGRLERLASTPGAARALLELCAQMDVRHLLPTISVPTLVVHRTGDRMCPVEGGRYLAAHIPGAQLVELPGDDHMPWVGGAEAVLAEIRAFLTGDRQPIELDRVLATVLFTDIVGSTERAAALGDRRWRVLREQHDTIVRRELTRNRGCEIETAGDSFLARFDGPARAVRCALAIVEALRPVGIDVRAGLHTGECELRGDRLGGIAVHIGARIAASAGAGEVLVSSTVKDLVAGSGLRFAERGTHVLKGVPDEWRLFAVEH